MILQGTTPTLTITVNPEELLLEDVTVLEVCDIGKAKSIAANTFANCYKLQTLIMRRTSVTTLANVSAFLNTPVRGRNSLTAKIYVPEALIDDYKAASNWKTIDGYGFVEWLPIEGSEYEL